MFAYQSVLFLHLATLVMLVGGSVVARVGISQLRGAQRVEQVTAWMHSFGALKLVFGVGSLLLLLTGAYLVGGTFSWTSGWIAISALTLVAIHVNGSSASVASFKPIGMALRGRTEGPVPAEAHGPLRAPRLWSAIHVNLGMVLAVMWVMVTKPAGAFAALFVLAGTAAGWTVARLTSSRAAVADSPATLEATAALEPMTGAGPDAAAQPSAIPEREPARTP
ncbi:MAG TPA: hypothetical protein VMS88_06345 [Terriglobales bacterium]|nr:hypothetical protein [Terriglobales bacterium]